MEESVRRQIAIALHVDRVRRPLIDQMKAGSRAVEFEIPAAKVSRRLHFPEGRAALRLEAQPCGSGKCLILLEAKLVAVFDPTLVLDAKALVHRAFDESRLALQFAGKLLSIVARARAIGIERDAQPRPFRFLALAAGDNLLLPLALPRVERLGEFLDLLVRHADLTIEALQFLRLLGRGHAQKRFGITIAHAVLAAFGHVVKEGVDAVIVPLRERIVFVIVALRATDRQPEPGDASRVDAIDHVKIEILRIDQAAFVAGHDIAVKAGRDLLVDGRAWQKIARDLFDRELVERQVRVERLDDPLAPEPHVAQRIVMIAARVAVARKIEPGNSQPLAKVRRREQTIHGALNCGLRIADCGLNKCIHLRDRRWQTGQIERHPPD